MNPSAIYSKSGKGVQEASGKTSLLKRADRAVLSAIDGRATLTEVAQKVGKPFDAAFQALITQLDRDGFVREVSAGASSAAAAPKAPPTFSRGPAAKSSPPAGGGGGGEDLDFTGIFTTSMKPAAPKPADDAARRAKEQEAALFKARQEAEARAQQERERARGEMEAKARAEAEAKFRAEAEKRVREEAEAKLKAEADAKAKAAREAAVRLAAEAKAKAEAEAQAKIEAERKAREEAERRAKEEAERVRREAEAAAQAKIEAERRAREEAERKAREEAEKARREAEELRQRLEEERKAREAEEKRRREEEERRRKEEEERRAREEAERKAREEAEHKAREAEEKRRREEREAEEARARKAKEEEEARRRREQEEREEREREAEERARREEQERERQEAQERERREEEARAAAAAAEPPPPAAAKAGEGGGLDSLLADIDSFSQREEEEERKRKADEEKRNARKEAERARAEEERRSREEAERRAKEEDEARARREREEEERAERERREAEERRLRESREAAAAAQAAAAARDARVSDNARVSDDIGVTEDDLDMDDVKRDEALVSKEARREQREREREARQREKEARERERAAARHAAEPRAYRPRRQRKWGRAAALTLFVVLVAGVGALHVMPVPVEEYENAASQALGRKVNIDSARLSLFTGVRLDLSGVAVGSSGKIAEVRAYPQIGSLFGESKAFTRVELAGVSLPQEAVAEALFAKAKGPNFSIERLVVKDLKVTGPLPLPVLEADARFDDEGVLRTATVSGPDGLNAKLIPGRDTVEFDVTASGFTLPFAQDVTLSSFAMKGSADHQGMKIDAWGGTLLDGALSGTANVRWGGNWHIEGVVTVRNINAAVFAPALLSRGKAEGTGKFSMSGPDPAKLGAATRIDGTFSVEKGVLGSFDLSRAIQTDGRQASGRTEFAEMNGQGTYDKGAVTLRNVTIGAGALQAGASADIARSGALSGRIVADIKTASQALRQTLILGGTVKDPQVRN